MKIDNYTHAHAHDTSVDAPTWNRTLGGEGLNPQSFTPAPTAWVGKKERKKSYQDRMRLEKMTDAEVDEILANAKKFSEALKVLGVGRKTFIGWVYSEPSRISRLGRRRNHAIWEE